MSATKPWPSIKIPADVRRRLSRVTARKESTEENKFVERAQRAGWPTRKLNGSGQRGWMDRLVCLPYGLSVFIEFKRHNREVEEDSLQAAARDKLRSLNHDVQEFKTAEDAFQYCFEKLHKYEIALGRSKK